MPSTIGSVLLQLLAFYLGGAMCLSFSTLAFRDRLEQLAAMTGRPAMLIAILAGLSWPRMVADVIAGLGVRIDPEVNRQIDREMTDLVATDKLRRAEIEWHKATAMYQHVEAAAERFDRAHKQIETLVAAHDLEAAASLYADADLLEAVGARDLVLKTLLRAVESADQELLQAAAGQAAFLLTSTPARPEVIALPPIEAA